MMIIMLISIMIMIMMLMPMLCRRPLAFISGHWAVPALNRDTCVPPSLSCESFLVLNIVHFIHFHFHLFVIVINRADFSAWVSQLPARLFKHKLSVRIHTKIIMRTPNYYVHIRFLCATFSIYEAFWYWLYFVSFHLWLSHLHSKLPLSQWACRANLRPLLLIFLICPRQMV